MVAQLRGQVRHKLRFEQGVTRYVGTGRQVHRARSVVHMKGVLK